MKLVIRQNSYKNKVKHKRKEKKKQKRLNLENKRLSFTYIQAVLFKMFDFI